MNLTGTSLSLLVLVLFVLTLIFLLLWQNKMWSKMLTQSETKNHDLWKMNQELMNRIQAGDLKSYLSLQVNSNLQEVEYPNPVSASDASELARLGSQEGLGEPIYDYSDDGEFRDTINELGFGFSEFG